MESQIVGLLISYAKLEGGEVKKKKKIMEEHLRQKKRKGKVRDKQRKKLY